MGTGSGAYFGSLQSRFVYVIIGYMVREREVPYPYCSVASAQLMLQALRSKQIDRLDKSTILELGLVSAGNENKISHAARKLGFINNSSELTVEGLNLKYPELYVPTLQEALNRTYDGNYEVGFIQRLKELLPENVAPTASNLQEAAITGFMNEGLASQVAVKCGRVAIYFYQEVGILEGPNVRVIRSRRQRIPLGPFSRIQLRDPSYQEAFMEAAAAILPPETMAELAKEASSIIRERRELLRQMYLRRLSR